jgi:hypothetical protein
MVTGGNIAARARRCVLVVDDDDAILESVGSVLISPSSS